MTKTPSENFHENLNGTLRSKSQHATAKLQKPFILKLALMFYYFLSSNVPKHIVGLQG